MTTSVVFLLLLSACVFESTRAWSIYTFNGHAKNAVQFRKETALYMAGGAPWRDVNEIFDEDDEDGMIGGEQQQDDGRGNVDENGQYIPTEEELIASMKPWDDNVPRLNTVHLIGRIGNDPEPRRLAGDKVVVNLSLAVKRKYHPYEWETGMIKPGQEATDWFILEIWDQKAEFVSKYVDKGQRVAVVGSLQVDEWNDKQTGEERNSVKVIVRDFDILETRAESELRRSKRGSRNYSGNSYSGGSSRSGYSGGAYSKNSGSAEDDEDDDEFVFGARDDSGGFFG